ncbi:Uncharacterised protein [Vibrio cholerae]|nr:Uncharacterised protein [Vibrio cholerae]CSI62247.1 Uncharacterised protein [Vibrio cholerae]
MLIGTVVVTGDHPSAHIHAFANLSIAKISQVIGF